MTEPDQGESRSQAGQQPDQGLAGQLAKLFGDDDGVAAADATVPSARSTGATPAAASAPVDLGVIFGDVDQEKPTGAPSAATPATDGPAAATRGDDATGRRAVSAADSAMNAGAGGTEPPNRGRATPIEQLRHASPPRSAWWRIGFPVVLALIVLAVPALVWLAKETILDTTEGRAVVGVDDPGAPGYEALAEPTPALLVVESGPDGELSAATVLTLPGTTSGGLVTIPPDTVVVDEAGTPRSLADAFAAGGAEQVQALVERQLNAGMGEVRLVAAGEWGQLVAPVAPLSVDNPDPVTVVDPDGARRIAYPAGRLELDADEVGVFLSSRSPDESDLNRMVRHQRFWAAWLQAVAAAPGEDAVPGEVDSGLGRFVRAMADAQVEMQTLPVQRVPIPGTDASVFDPLDDQIPTLVARLVPFPVGAPPGARLRVRVLDGTGRLQNGLPAARAVVLGGGEVTTVGNARSFDRAATQIIYTDEARRPEVEALRESLGVGLLVTSEEVTDAVDVTIILGTDAESQLGDTTVTTATVRGSGQEPG